MDNSRPRYVNPSYQINVPPDLLSPTPPFVQEQDPYAGLMAVLNNLSSGIQPVQQMSKVETILQSLAQAAAIAASPDPGGVLQQQIGQRQQAKQQQDLMTQQRQQKIQDIMLQAQMHKAETITKAQQDLINFQREAAYKTRERKETEEFDIYREEERERRQFNIDTIKRDWPIQDKEKELRLQKKLEAEFLPQDLERLTKSEAVRNVDERRAARDTKEMWYRMAGISAENAGLMAESWLNGTELTPSQSKLLDRASKFYANKANQKFAADLDTEKAQAYHYRKSGDAAVVRAGLEKAQFDRMDRAFDETTARKLADLQTEQFVHMKDGSLKLYDGLPKQAGYLPPGADRMATDEERRNHVGELYKAYLKDMDDRKAAKVVPTPGATGSPAPVGSPTPAPTVIPTPNAAPGAPPTELENARMQVGQVVAYERDVLKTPPAQINARLDKLIQKYPQYAQMYEGFKIRTAANPTAQGTPQPTTAPGTSVEDYTQKRRAQLKKESMFGGGAGSQIRTVSPEEKKLLEAVEKNRDAWEKAKKEFQQRNP